MASVCLGEEDRAGEWLPGTRCTVTVTAITDALETGAPSGPSPKSRFETRHSPSAGFRTAARQMGSVLVRASHAPGTFFFQTRRPPGKFCPVGMGWQEGAEMHMRSSASACPLHSKDPGKF